MTGAIEFLTKAKAICKASERCKGCTVFPLCHKLFSDLSDEADLVRKVMAYQLKEDKDAEGN